MGRAFTSTVLTAALTAGLTLTAAPAAHADTTYVCPTPGAVLHPDTGDCWLPTIEYTQPVTETYCRDGWFEHSATLCRKVTYRTDSRPRKCSTLRAQWPRLQDWSCTWDRRHRTATFTYIWQTQQTGKSTRLVCPDTYTNVDGVCARVTGEVYDGPAVEVG